MKVSVVVTVRNEAHHLRHLLDSLEHQEHLHEVLLVDADSDDDTVAIAESYTDRMPIKIHVERCSRGAGRNLGAQHASGDLLAFIDGDCIANANWLRHVVEAAQTHPKDVIAGRTVTLGFWAFAKLQRVELPHRGHDTTWPSCNLAYPKALFEVLGGFDERFITAEDIDLNYRAIEGGARIIPTVEAIVYARARESVGGFLRQAFWNGYGRKQLTHKHGGLWHQYRVTQMIRRQGASVWGVLRMAAGLMGYLKAKLERA